MGGEPCVWCGGGFTPQCMVRQNCSLGKTLDVIGWSSNFYGHVYQ